MSQIFFKIKRRFTAFRLFACLLILILLHHYLFKSRGSPQTGQTTGFYKPQAPSSKPSLKQEISLQKKVGVTTENDKSQRVIDAFRHCWKGYKKHAWGFDEYHPLTKKGSDWFSLGLTIVDALDTAFLMNQMDIFKEARDWVSTDLRFDFQEGESNVFEITIRVLGGLMSAFHFTNDPMFLAKSKDLGDRLMVAFETSSTIPLSSINFKERKAIPAPHGAGSSTSEATTLQMEFKYLTFLTNDPKYWNVAQNAMKTVLEQKSPQGLVPLYIDPHTGNFAGNEIRLGSRGDSYYEYLIKQWMMTNRTETRYKTEYHKAVQGVRSKLLTLSYPDYLFYIGETDTNFSFQSSKMDHLVCFIAGTLAWGATNGKSVFTRAERNNLSPESIRDLNLAEELARSCYEMYAQTPTGLSPEIVFWNHKKPEEDPHFPKDLFEYHTSEKGFENSRHSETRINPQNDETNRDTRFKAVPKSDGHLIDFQIHSNDGHNLMRPETVESLFILYRITGKQIYREWGWHIFEAFEKHSKVAEGYTSLDDVRLIPAIHRDKMETFFLGETLKYLYLLFTDKDLVPLDKYIFNTEAHPFPVFDISSIERAKELIFLNE